MKSHKLKAIATSFVTLGLALSYNACTNAKFVFSTPTRGGTASQNTVAGNPMTANKLVTGLCKLVSRCHPDVSEADCRDGILRTEGFATILNLPSAYSSLAAILQAESQGTLAGSTLQAESCQQSLAATACSDPRVQAAYDASAKDPYAGTVNLLADASCGKALTPVLKYSCPSVVFLRGKAVEAQSPVVASQGLTYSVAPSLPSGLSFDTATGAISGTPTSIVSEADYTVSAMSGSNRIEQHIRIRTADGFAVDSLADEANAGGSNCQTASGTCTLRAAIQAANASSAAKTILAPQGAIQLTSGRSLVISAPVEIIGDCQQGTVVDGLSATNVLEINAGPSRIEKLTIQNGKTSNGSGAGVAIISSTSPFTAVLQSVVVRNNVNNGGSTGMAIGAGISVFGTPSAPVQLDLNDSLIEGNQNQLGNFGGGLGLWSDTATKITNCTFKDNYSYGGGGAISTHSGDLTVAQSLFTNNKSDGDGGAIFINHGANRDATLTNVTFDSNNGRAGGGVYIGAMSMTVLNSTFAGNNATSAWYGGALAGMPTGVTIENSLFSNNKSNGVLAHCQASGPWAVSSRGSNLSDAPASDCNFTLASDLTSRSVSLAPLDDYGGPTKTFALLPWSPAIGHGNAATCAAVDQRSFDRRSNGTCDIGAYEFQ